MDSMANFPLAMGPTLQLTGHLHLCMKLTALSFRPATLSARVAIRPVRRQPCLSKITTVDEQSVLCGSCRCARSSTPTPTPVGNVETKRMVQRRASTQSQVNPVGGRRSASVSGTLRRSSSNSSMTARTFRERSPHRPATSSGPVNVPPLPNLPTQYAARKLPNGRAISMGPSMRSPPASPPRSKAKYGTMEEARPSTLIHTNV